MAIPTERKRPEHMTKTCLNKEWSFADLYDARPGSGKLQLAALTETSNTYLLKPQSSRTLTVLLHI